MHHSYLSKSLTLNYQAIKEYDVVIVGAGLSGLTAAFRLLQLKPNLKIKILEAKDRIGGRIFTIELPAANNSVDVWDLGGTWIGNKFVHPFINHLIAELNMETYLQNFDGKKYLQVGRYHKVSAYNSSIPNLGIMTLFSTASLIKKIEGIQEKLFKNPQVSPEDLEYYDSITMDNFIKSRAWSEGTLDCAKVGLRSIFGTELNKLSALYTLLYFNSCGGLLNMIESNETSCQGYKIVGGAHKMCQRILEIIGPEHLELDTVVTSINQITNAKQEYVSLISTLPGKMYMAKHVVIAIPTHLIPSIQFQPLLSPVKYEYFSSVVPGHLIKVILTYDTAFWRESGFSGEVVTNGGPSFTEGCSSGPLCIVFDATTKNNSPALMGLIAGKQALEYEQKTKDERKEAVLKSLETFFHKKDVRNYIVYCEKIWRQESYVGGCPLSTVPPGVAQCLNQSLRAPENQIYFAISELAQRWIGFMEGAVESGEKAALDIISNY